MKKTLFAIFSALAFFTATTAPAVAGPDLFTGDTSIYGGVVTGAKTNVLFLIDNSAGMTQEGMAKAYDPSKTYAGAYSSNEIYVREAATGGTINYNDYGLAASSITCTSALQALVTGTASYDAPGVYYGPLTKSGDCGGSNTKSGNYYIGNFLNFLTSPQNNWTADSAYSVGDVVYPPGDDSTTYECVTAGTSGGSAPTWPTTPGVQVTDGTVVWQLRPSSILKMTQDAITDALGAIRDRINAGVMVFGDNNHGGKILDPILDISDTSATGETNFPIVTASVDNITLNTSNLQQINEALWDAGVYYLGNNNKSQLKISSDTASYPSPIQYSCQFNYIIVLTTGNTEDTTQTKKYLTDLNGNGTTGDAVDAALYNYTKKIQTSVIQLLSPEVPILRDAAEKTGGNYYQVWNTKDLKAALYDTLANIVEERDTSFVAPVVPVSPENRTYSGSRVYMGFFKPIKQQYWHGNLKKYGLDSNNNVIDAIGNPATWVDLNGDRIDDRMTAATGALPPYAINGSFRTTAESFWNTIEDGGNVNRGGAGEKLYDRDFTSSIAGTDPRKIYTYTGTSKNLIDPSNAFTTDNSAITATTLAEDSTPSDRDDLINFIHGIDVYDEDQNGNTSEKRGYDPESIASGRDFFGDVLHSRPLIVSYATYTTAQENTSANKSIIFVGSNDGMLHAIRDYDGKELWAFIPPDMLGNLKYLKGHTHSYYVDSTPVVYTYDYNNDGTIETADGDKVIIVFGERRGGGSDATPTSGSYFALDVSDPAAPVLLWQINNATSGYSELAETWSEPKLVKMKIGTAEKVVAFVGGGYDNIHEDTRFGNTRLFSNASSVIDTDVGDGDVVSGGLTSAASLTGPKGRGIYAIEIATLDSGGVPSFTNSGNKVWGYTYGSTVTSTTNAKTDPNMKFSIPSEISAQDSNHDGYTNRLYVGDTGGQVWRFDVGSSSTSSWTGRRLFNLSANSTAGTSGSGIKFFYKPSIVEESAYTMLYLGSGDRAHPLNRDADLVDAFYALKDEGQTSTLDEGNLTDVTADLLQDPSTTAATASAILASLDSSYGWYIKLDQNHGEKVLAAPTVFNKVAYFTTYAPDVVIVPDPCKPGNEGTARIYAVNYLTGESVLDYDPGNDTATDEVLQRSDRVMSLGVGIPSGIVLVINPGGQLKALIGVGGVIAGADPKKGGSIVPIYWRQK
jgi:type IV pilus assembly protein PilY1